MPRPPRLHPSRGFGDPNRYRVPQHLTRYPTPDRDALEILLLIPT